ncbi:MAG: hypothetical protein GY786_21645 [Proteobacteria bacterium]|nr:hypothetical protein [Pseudomonadota bacterium]
MKKILLVILLILPLNIIPSLLAAENDSFLIPERRRPQKSAIANRYYLVPWVVNIEGIGVLPGLVTGVANIADSGTNGAAINFQNDNFHVKALAVDDLFLLGNYKSWFSLTISAGVTDIELLELDAYEVGTNSSSTPFQVEGILKQKAFQVQLRLLKDRIKFSSEYLYSNDFFRLANDDGSSVESENSHNRLKLELDFTDDRYDSRVGVRAILIKSSQNQQGNFFGENDTAEEYDVISRELSLFIPIHKTATQVHTLAMNYYLSTSTNLNSDIPLNRRNGNDLGGPVRMRGYPDRRFVDNNTLYYALEHRWNFLGDFGTKELDFIFSNDTLEGLQLAFFYEWGQVSEFDDASLYQDMKTDLGVGFRAIWDSNLVMRLDLGFSEEGSGTTFLIMQPF